MKQAEDLHGFPFRATDAPAIRRRMSNGAAPVLELPVPKSKRAVLGAIVLTTFILCFTSLAIYNLFSCVGIVPSMLWLVLVGTVLVGLSKSKGYKQFAIDILGAFSSKEFIQNVRSQDGRNEIQFGYRFFRHRFVYLGIPVEKIEHVHWSVGQLSDRTGRDMNDWSVAVWYDHGDPAKSERNRKWHYPDQDVHRVGPTGRKNEIAAFGHLLLDFLRKAGANLMQGENDCTFVRQ